MHSGAVTAPLLPCPCGAHSFKRFKKIFLAAEGNVKVPAEDNQLMELSQTPLTVSMASMGKPKHGKAGSPVAGVEGSDDEQVGCNDNKQWTCCCALLWPGNTSDCCAAVAAACLTSADPLAAHWLAPPVGLHCATASSQLLSGRDRQQPHS
jgi:hypothetical protein